MGSNFQQNFVAKIKNVLNHQEWKRTCKKDISWSIRTVCFLEKNKNIRYLSWSWKWTRRPWKMILVSNGAIFHFYDCWKTSIWNVFEATPNQTTNRFFTAHVEKKEIAGALGFLRKLSKTQKITGVRITQWMVPTTESGGVSLDLITVVVERPGWIFMITSKGPHDCVPDTWMEFPSAFSKNPLEWQKGSGPMNLSHLKRACT